MPNVSMTDFTAAQQDIERRRRMAEMLQMEGMKPIEQQTAGGYVVPMSWTQGLAKALQGIGGGYMQGQASQEQRALAGKARDEARNFMESLQGTPATPGTPATSFAPTTADYQDNPNLDVQASGQVNVPAQPGMPATPLTPELYKAKLMEGAVSGHPTIAPFAGSIYAKMLEQELKANDPYNLAPNAKRMVGNKVIAENFKPTEHVINGKIYVSTPEGGFVEKAGPGLVITPGEQARLDQAERHWSQLSPYQQQTLGQGQQGLGLRAQSLGLERAGLGLRAQDFQFNTGQTPNIPIPNVGLPPMRVPTGVGQQTGQQMPPTQQMLQVPSAPVAGQRTVPTGVPASAPNVQQPISAITPKAAAEMAADTEKQARGARQVLSQLKFDKEGVDDISKMINESTSGFVQNWNSKLWGAATGSATSGQEAIQKLKAFSAQMTMDLMGGKLGSGISNADREFVIEQLGNVSDPNVPANARLAAWGSVLDRLKSRATLGQQKSGASGGWGIKPIP